MTQMSIASAAKLLQAKRSTQQRNQTNDKTRFAARLSQSDKKPGLNGRCRRGAQTGVTRALKAGGLCSGAFLWFQPLAPLDWDRYS